MNKAKRIKLLKHLLRVAKALLELKQEQKNETPQEYNALHVAAISFLGVDASPDDVVPDELGCAETVSNIIDTVTPFPIITGTWTLYDTFNRSTQFNRVFDPAPGDIVISPTGESRLGNKAPFVGHVGIVGANDTIMSNDSATGKWMSNYTIETWNARWKTNGGYPVLFYRLAD